jgi:hypothetical protein
MSADRRRHAMIRACRLAIARGERPLFWVLVDLEGDWSVDAASWLTGPAPNRTEARAAAGAALAELLEVDPDALEVVVVT